MNVEELNDMIDYILPRIKKSSDAGGLFDVVGTLRKDRGLSIQHGNVVRNELVDERLVERGNDDPKKVRILPFGTDILEKHGTWSAYLSHKDAIATKQAQLLRLEKKANAERLKQEDRRAEQNLLLTEKSVKATRNSALAAWGSAAATFFSVIVSVYGCYENKVDTSKRLSVDTLSTRILKLEQELESFRVTQRIHEKDTLKLPQPPEKKVVNKKI